jgi:hypothetical protein
VQEIFEFPLPPTLNDQINDARKHWTVSAKSKEFWTNQIALLCYGKQQFPGKVWVECHFYLKSFGRDPDNVLASLKYVFDGMVQAGILVNDNLNIIQSPLIPFFKKGKDCVTIIVSDKSLFEEVYDGN